MSINKLGNSKDVRVSKNQCTFRQKIDIILRTINFRGLKRFQWTLGISKLHIFNMYS